MDGSRTPWRLGSARGTAPIAVSCAISGGSSLSQFVDASTQPSPSAATQSALRDAHKVIDSACELAARGY